MPNIGQPNSCIGQYGDCHQGMAAVSEIEIGHPIEPKRAVECVEGVVLHRQVGGGCYVGREAYSTEIISVCPVEPRTKTTLGSRLCAR